MRKLWINISKEDLFLLDGICSPKLQKVIDKIKDEPVRAKRVISKMSPDEVKKQAITHCVICYDSVKNLRNHNGANVIKRLSGYFCGRDENNRPILVCEECYNKYINNKNQQL